MKYNEIIKNSKFYLPMNLNLGYLLSDTEIVLLMNLIHYSELGKKVSIPSLVKFTARSDSTIKRAIKKLRMLKLVSEDGYKPILEQIALVYDSVNAAKSIEEREAWCNAYKESEGQIEPLKQGQSEPMGLGQSEPMKRGQNEPSKKGQFDPPYKEDINKEDSYKEYNKEDSYKEYNKEDSYNEDFKYNINSNILMEKKESKENKLKEEFEVATEGVEENQNESKSQIERNDDSNPFQPKENSLLTPRENKEIAKALKALEFLKPSIDTNTLNTCLDLLHEVSQSNRYNYMSLLTKAHHSFIELLKDYTKEERKAFFKALNDISSVLGDAFHRYDTKQK